VATSRSPGGMWFRKRRSVSDDLSLVQKIHRYEALGEQRLHRDPIERAGQQKALCPIATQLKQCPGRCGSLDAFGDDV
jgi:hypothetical protein